MAFCLCSIPTVLFAQQNDNLTYGMQAGPTYSWVSNLQTTILSEPYYLNYTLKKKPRVGFTAGGYVEYKTLHTALVLGAQLTYSQQGSELDFNNSEKNFHYTMTFGYQYVNALLLAKFYPFEDPQEPSPKGFNVSFGPQLGFNLSPENIKYKSGGPGYQAAFGSDLEQQQQLRNVLKGKNIFGPSVGLGYKLNSGFIVDARVFIGITDVVETQANSYNFIENKNTNTAFQITFGYDFSLLSRER
jgi:hypothetical protein